MQNKVNSALAERRANKTAAADLQDLFNSNNGQDCQQDSRIVELPMDMLVEYDNAEFFRLYNQPQPFREYTDEELDALAESIEKVGVLEPAVVRPWNGKYQLLTGRHRKRASSRAGKTTVPCLIKNVDDDTAALIMIDTNLNQRHNLLYSEKAFAYRIQLEILNRQGYRTDLNTSCNDCTKIDSLAEAGRKNKDSRRMVAYYIRLSYLLPELLKMVDSEELPVMSGVHISNLSEDNQNLILSWLKGNRLKIKEKQAKDIYDAAEENDLTIDFLHQMFAPSTAPKQAQKFSISRKKWKEYDDILPQDAADFENLFRQFLDWLRVKGGEFY